MIPVKQRRIIEGIFEDYGVGIKMLADDRVPLDTLYVLEEEGSHTLHGSVRYINWARAIRDHIYIPECYDEAASTWA